jgi:hypothetical protein
LRYCETGRTQLAVEHARGARGSNGGDSKGDGGRGKKRAPTTLSRRYAVLFTTAKADWYARPHVVGTWRGNSFGHGGLSRRGDFEEAVGSHG